MILHQLRNRIDAAADLSLGQFGMNAGTAVGAAGIRIRLPHAALTAPLSFGKDLATNGKLRTITVTPPATMTAH